MKTILKILILLTIISGHAQVEKNSELYLQMKQLDSIVFEAGFNNCNLKALEAVLTDDLEFYHDVGGIQNKAEFLQAMEKNICGRPGVHITRRLVDESFEVFPLKSNNMLYGVYLHGEHEFFEQFDGQKKQKTGYAKFSSYYELQERTWKLKRVFSFDHRAAQQ